MIPTEAQEGEALVAYLRIKGYKFTHIPNETGHSLEAKRRAIRMKRQGVSKGFPDYLVLTPKGLAVVELKRTKGSSTSAEQLEWIAAFNAAGIPAKVCKGSEQAIEFIEEIAGGY